MSMTGRYGTQPWHRRFPYSAVVSMNPVEYTTAAMLYNALSETKTCHIKTRSYRWAPERAFFPEDCDEVYPNIFIGDGETAKNKTYLKMIGITHVLNTAEGNNINMVNTGQYFYHDTGFKYLGLRLLDVPTTRISVHFSETSDFIDDALLHHGKVYVHCLMGISRSSTCVIAYLMIKRGMSAVDAIKLIKQKRDIQPNEGFLEQLAELDNQLRRKRESRYSLGMSM